MDIVRKLMAAIFVGLLIGMFANFSVGLMLVVVGWFLLTVAVYATTLPKTSFLPPKR